MPSCTGIPGGQHDHSTGCAWFVGLVMLVSGCADAPSSDAMRPSSEPQEQNTQGLQRKTPEELLADPLVPPIVIHSGRDAVPVLMIQYGPDSWEANRSVFSSDTRARFEPHGDQVCASGCAASRHPTPQLDTPAFHKLMAAYRFEPMDASSSALESLLFYGRQTQQLLDQHGDRPLDSARAEFLRRELRRTHAMVAFRIVDQQGLIRTQMPPTRIPLDRRHVFDMENTDLPPLVTSGTVKRVGLHHLWTRI